jgi:hypothetical protein
MFEELITKQFKIDDETQLALNAIARLTHCTHGRDMGLYYKQRRRRKISTKVKTARISTLNSNCDIHA